MEDRNNVVLNDISEYELSVWRARSEVNIFEASCLMLGFSPSELCNVPIDSLPREIYSVEDFLIEKCKEGKIESFFQNSDEKLHDFMNARAGTPSFSVLCTNLMVKTDALQAVLKDEEMDNYYFPPQITDYKDNASVKHLSDIAKIKTAHSKEKKSLLKMIIVMAVEGYGHDVSAQKTKIVAEIVGDLASNGLDLSEDTVRKYLKESSKLINPNSGKKS